MSAQNPDRQEWERDWTMMRNRRDIALRKLAAEYRVKAATADPQQTKTSRREQRKAEAAIVREHQHQDFGAWLQHGAKETRPCSSGLKRCSNSATSVTSGMSDARSVVRRSQGRCAVTR
jgi:hypothetical protein